YVVLINTQGIILSSNLFEYQPSKKWLLNTQKPFTGNVKLIMGVDSNLLSRGGLCVTGVRSFWLCSFNKTGPQHAPGQCNASSTEYIVEYEIGPCSAEGDGNGAAEVSDSSSGPGGGGSSGGGSTIPVDTSISLPPIRPDEEGKCPDGYIKDLATNECIKIEEEDDKIINNLTGKAKCVYDKLLASGISNFHNMITDLFIEFGDNNIGGRDLTFEMSSDLPDNIGGKTQIDNDGNYRILINENLNNKYSSIEIAGIITHEIAHAFLAKHYYNSTASFSELYQRYINDTGLMNYSHDIMKDYFINRMAIVLKKYDNSIFSNFDDYKILVSYGVFNLSDTQKKHLINVKNQARLNDNNCN
ncbi:hypothetical protein ACQY1Q_17350, partial [Tenacibaculum sp. TC6]